ncbi:nicotinate (nicotinamide) nucleotide adenylyltransferase [Helicobacter aurati]|uniref:Probable nicotinate-nucleotide adenylyltransferase n=1 Tax=Helicobacter aurati TaxID=137778 RepID=A0A3D8J5I5_9HELI|nr:nicotinate (nicotinamide) nucleotide adenylyltransferase [Helicobacter aurati]RDU72708.1 nicotinate (nicotinamide) nucleotide adenylyltransferase [Helicobacter aurati]
MNIAIFGGSFDPPHVGHVNIIRQCLKTLDITKFIVVVAYQNRLKKTCRFQAEKRLLWMQALLQNIAQEIALTQSPSILCSDYEVKRQKPIPTIETIKYFKELYQPQKIYCVIGEDNLTTLDKWVQFNELISLVEFVVIHRNHVAQPHCFNDMPLKLRYLPHTCDISSTTIMQNFVLHQTNIPLCIREYIQYEYNRIN